MNYFKILGVVFGLLALLKPVYMHLLPWDENTFLEKFYSEKRPFWIIPIVLVGLFLVGLTWYKHLTLEIPYSLVLTILFSLTAIKGITLLVDYSRFQRWVATMLKKEKGRSIILIDIGAGVLGLAIIVLTILLY